MKFSIVDKNVNLPMNIFLVLGNIINIIQNVPQVYKTYKTKSTGDFSMWFLLMRVIANIIWTAYAIYIGSFPMIFNNSITIISTSYIGYYKAKEMYKSYILKKQKDRDEENLKELVVIDDADDF